MAAFKTTPFLRIAVVKDGVLLETHTLKGRRPVTVGASFRNTLVLPLDALPERFALLVYTAGHWHLRFTNAMQVRLGVDDAVLDQRVLLEQGLANETHADLFSVPLSRRGRGKITIDGYSILFHPLTSPARAREDLSWLVDRQRRYVLTALVPLAIALSPLLTTLPISTSQAEPEEALPEPIVTTTSSQAREEIEATASPALINPTHPQAREKINDLDPHPTPSEPTASVEPIEASPPASTISDTPAVSPPKPTTPKPAAPRPKRRRTKARRTPSALAHAGPGIGRPLPRRSKGIEQDIRQVIQVNKGALTHCYTRHLRHHPDLTGRLSVSLKVRRNGRVRSVRVAPKASANRELQRCMRQAIQRWRFPRHEDQAPMVVRFPVDLRRQG